MHRQPSSLAVRDGAVMKAAPPTGGMSAFCFSGGVLQSEATRSAVTTYTAERLRDASGFHTCIYILANIAAGGRTHAGGGAAIIGTGGCLTVCIRRWGYSWSVAASGCQQSVPVLVCVGVQVLEVDLDL